MMKKREKGKEKYKGSSKDDKDYKMQRMKNTGQIKSTKGKDEIKTGRQTIKSLSNSCLPIKSLSNCLYVRTK